MWIFRRLIWIVGLVGSLSSLGDGALYVVSANSSGGDVCTIHQSTAFGQAVELADQQCPSGWKREAVKFTPNSADETCPNGEGQNSVSVALKFRCLN